MARKFEPRYLMLSGTYQCNLSCPHCCVPIEWPDRLPIDVALRLVDQAHAYGIREIGFTGGEPFLYLEFLTALIQRTASLGWRFDKIQTNGVWYEHQDHLADSLQAVRDAGYTGKLGLSVDKFHGLEIDALARFCKAARIVFQRDNIIALNYASKRPDQGLEPIERLAKSLDAVIEWSDWLKRYLVVSSDLTMTCNWNHLAPVERAEALGKGWEWDGVWFQEDYCEGPGQALIITPKGEVKPCCGFASDLDQLTIGNIYTETLEDIVLQARQHPYVGRVFSEGLLAIKDEILKRDPKALPGATSNQCFLCWYILTRGMADGMPGGGGQIGRWTQTVPNYRGELITLGMKSVIGTESKPSMG